MIYGEPWPDWLLSHAIVTLYGTLVALAFTGLVLAPLRRRIRRWLDPREPGGTQHLVDAIAEAMRDRRPR